MPIRIDPPRSTYRKRELEESEHTPAPRKAPRHERLSINADNGSAWQHQTEKTPRPPRPAIETRKAEPYLPDKGRPRENLNGAAEVTGTTIVCRHLSVEYAMASGKKSAALESLSSVERIQAHFAPLGTSTSLCARVVEKVIDAINVPDTRHLINADKLGEYLVLLGQQLSAPSAPREANVLLSSHTHLMALHIERKERKPHEADAGAHYFAVKLYEPNATANHVRVEAAEPEDLNRFRLADFHHVAGWNEFGHPDLVAVCSEVPLRLGAARLASGLGRDSFALAAMYDMPEIIDALSAELEAAADKAQWADLLRYIARRTSSSPPVLHRLMSDERNSNFLAAIFRLFEVAGRTLGSDVMESLMAARSSAGVHALTRAALFGKSLCVLTFGQAVARLGLSPADTVKLLAAVEPQSHLPALHLACMHGHADCVLAYSQILGLLGDRLTMDQKLALFDAAAPDGVTAAEVAAQNGRLATSLIHSDLRYRMAGLVSPLGQADGEHMRRIE